MNNWNLDKLYKGYDDPAFSTDLATLDVLIADIKRDKAALVGYADKVGVLKRYLTRDIEFSRLADRLYQFVSLKESVNSTDQEAVKLLNLFQTKFTELTATETAFKAWVANYPNLSADIEANPLLKEHQFRLEEICDKAKYMLDEKTESLIAKLRQTGSMSWGRLQSLLTSTVAVTYEGKEITLSEVRNLAYDSDASVRKAAYIAELAAYQTIEKPIAFALNGIKGEVNTLAEARGYASPLAWTLKQSRMSQATLDAMLAVMQDYLPVFRAYLKRKAKLLGHQIGLPFYDLFAPVGNIARTYTVEQARAYVLKNFKTFNPKLYEMAVKAFDEGWIDFFPQKGKVGGAFCSNIHSISESRILTNFTGVFGDIITLAHELGHAYHGEAIFGESILNSDYTMPVAETASTFCETIVNQAAYRDAKSDVERIYLLESSIQDYTQVIVDILSRFLFEKAVFDGRKTTVFDENELKTMMLDAQKQTYGDGLDQEILHPYMWACKGHYYSGGLNYYNFPYAFGLLFAKGLFAKYLQDKKGFIGKYDLLLASTGKNTVEATAALAGIDVTGKAFWQGSLELLKQDIERFLKLTE